MINSINALYIVYFWKYATAEQIQDMCVLSTDMIVDYILEIGKDYYFQYGIAKEDKKNNISVLDRLNYYIVK